MRAEAWHTDRGANAINVTRAVEDGTHDGAPHARSSLTCESRLNRTVTVSRKGLMFDIYDRTGSKMRKHQSSPVLRQGTKVAHRTLAAIWRYDHHLAGYQAKLGLDNTEREMT